ncbi:hypothetical protein TSUD_251270 [Trifolium subterraneum]|uniref:Uncharacterized protein n=1 Tax=Trifolium subterraneum TaxID=3900 RepID=A0A2Z6LR52_TRISU|nr:hypothetical protein TSUD_251270 [Trifolium subterraneum]
MITRNWNNERVEKAMDLIESTVKSIRSLAKERRDSFPGKAQGVKFTGSAASAAAAPASNIG